MNIKSELSKPILWFTTFTTGMLLFSLLMSIILCIIIVASGMGIIVKLGFLITFGFGSLISAYDGHDDKEVKDKRALEFGLIMITIIIITEIGLFSMSKYTSDVPIASIVTDEIRNVVITKDGNGKAIKTDKISFKRVTYFDLDTNEKLGYRDVEKGEEGKLDFFTNITSKHVYIDYFPFFTYNEEYRYMRTKEVEEK